MLNYSPIPIEIIVAATNGDANALEEVVHYYEGYIRYLSTHIQIDKDGNEIWMADEHIQRQLEAKLVESIITGFTIRPE